MMLVMLCYFGTLDDAHSHCSDAAAAVSIQRRNCGFPPTHHTPSEPAEEKVEDAHRSVVGWVPNVFAQTKVLWLLRLMMMMLDYLRT